MRGEQIERFQEDNSTQQRDLNLNDVFNKITDIWHQQNSVSNVVLKPQLKLSSEVIESVLPETLNVGCGFFGADENEDGGASQALARRLEDELRAAKTAHLSCGEVLLPADLLPRIARDVIRMAENEPCGLRGCTLFINFENEQECRKIGTIKCDPSTVSTFELYLTLKQDSSSWHSLLPQFLKNLTRGGTIMISRGFVLEKKKLYRSYREV